jgi:hypothetical protein
MTLSPTFKDSAVILSHTPGKSQSNPNWTVRPQVHRREGHGENWEIRAVGKVPTVGPG